MKTCKAIIGIILILIAIYLFVAMTDPTAKYVGGIILLIIGLVLLFSGCKKGSKKSKKDFLKLESFIALVILINFILKNFLK